MFALDARHGLPTLWVPEGTKTFVFTKVRLVFLIVWVIALVMLVYKIVKSWPEIRQGLAKLRKAT